jgi:putative transposase
MKYNPLIHHRKSIRLKGYDYSQAGLYFITICCQNRLYRFGDVKNGEMFLNEYGQIAYDEWGKLAERFKNFELDVFQIMPNHMHGIILLNNPIARAGFTPAPVSEKNDLNIKKRQPQGIAPTIVSTIAPLTAPVIAPTVGDMVGAYKSLVANGCLEIYKSKNKTMGKLWQRNYYEIIIRDEKAYRNISNYIINNPAKWDADKFYKS